MPIYEYGCEKCGRDFEELVFGDEMPACPYCGSTETHKLMSRCARCRGDGGMSFDMAPPASGGGCAGCSGGNCASCGQ
ncbi:MULTISPECIES: zinc ribbon domain-containing protein [unclassified Desulfovibrio]|uniref:FmdB family zinc ribbon protein n=1 Tax=unclassified Desulfovibrio TaxID=2593640 RepID=UPI0013EA09FC|nr:MULTISPECIES: zinc ribbon domain-containing protein [unclassified Desulfovibrio]